MRSLSYLIASLSWLGRQGTQALAALVLVGIAFPWLGQVLRPLVTEAVFILLCTAFMRMHPAAVRAIMQRPLLVLAATGWTMILVPVILGGICLLLGVDTIQPELYLALVLQAVASPIMSAPAMAVLMGCDGVLVLIILVSSSILVPLTVPLFTALFAGAALSIPPLLLAGRLMFMLAGAAAVGFAVRRFMGVTRLERYHAAIDGFNLIILFVFVAAVMEGVGVYMIREPLTVVVLLLLAFGIFFAILLVSFLLFLPAGRGRALAISIMVSQRNMGLMLAATGAVLPELAWLYFALAQFPIFLSPHLLRPVVRWLAARD